MSESCGPMALAGSVLLIMGCAAALGACALPSLSEPRATADMRLGPRHATRVVSNAGGPGSAHPYSRSAPSTGGHYRDPRMLRVAYAGYPTLPLARAHAEPAIDAYPQITTRTRMTGRRVVRFAANYPAGSIVVVNNERALYLVTADRTAIRYPVSIGNSAQQWTGLEFVTAKRVNPTWYPLSEPGRPTPAPVPGGHPDNPLGPRALYLGTTLWRIHGTTAPGSIGRAISNGCIRMLNEDVLDLYDRISLGTEVFVVAHLAAPPPVLPGAKLAR